MQAEAVTADQAHREGYDAFRAGVSRSGKPYSTRTPQGQAWVDGWLQAQLERADAERAGTWNTPASEASAAAEISGNALHERYLPRLTRPGVIARPGLFPRTRRL